MRYVLCLTALLSLVCMASAQTSATPFGGSKPPATETTPATTRAEKSGLEKAIEEALKSNPDLRVAAAKVNEAEASLSRTRLQVTQKVVTAYQDVEIGKATVRIAQVTLERMRNLQKTKAIAVDIVTQKEQELAAAKGKLAAAEADLNYLLGKSALNAYSGLNSNSLGLSYTQGMVNAGFGQFGSSSLGGLGGQFGGMRGQFGTSSLGGLGGQFGGMGSNIVSLTKPTGDKIRKALDHRVTIRFSETSARDALKMILKETQGLHVQASFKDPAWDEKLTANLTEMPLGAVLQLLEDALGNHAIVVRGYGLLIVSKNQVPPGAVLLNEFWQGGVKSPSATTTTNPPKK